MEFQRYEAMLDDGIDLARLKYSEMRILRKDLQIIFQDPYSSLNPRFTIGQIIEEGLVTHKFFRHGSPKMREHVVRTMKQCGLQEYMLFRYPHHFHRARAGGASEVRGVRRVRLGTGRVDPVADHQPLAGVEAKGTPDVYVHLA